MNHLGELKKQVCRANRDLLASGLVMLTWGNVSGLSGEDGKMVIKPSGVDYRKLTPQNMIVVSVATGKKCSGDMDPSSDTPTHLEIYRAFPSAGGIVHTHSPYATVWAQAAMPLPCLGTTHADTFDGAVPVCRQLTPEEVLGDYESNVGRVIGEHFSRENLDPLRTPAVLVPGHGPFVWGEDAAAAVQNAIVLEEVAKMAFLTRCLQPGGAVLPDAVREKHFNRKHGPDAYYGQPAG